jgi:YggT family protein
MSWLPIDNNNGLVDFLYAVTDPLLDPIKLLIKKSIFGGKGTGMLDFSPIIAFLILQLLQTFIKGLL